MHKYYVYNNIISIHAMHIIKIKYKITYQIRTEEYQVKFWKIKFILITSGWMAV